jgi:hypothetical protein
MANWTLKSQPFGPNRAPVLVGTSSTDGSTPIPVAVNPATGALILSVSNALVSAPLVGQAKIASTGTAVQLNGGTSQPLTNGVIITALSGNAATIEIGGSGVTNTSNGTGNGYILAAGASISFAAADTSDIWINGSSGDIVSWAGS